MLKCWKMFVFSNDYSAKDHLVFIVGICKSELSAEKREASQYRIDQLMKDFVFALSKYYLANYMLVWIIQVLEVLSSSSELVDLLYKVDIAYHSKPSCSSESDDVLKYVLSIREQLKVSYNWTRFVIWIWLDNEFVVLKIMYTLYCLFQDREDGLTETDADGSFLHEHWNSDLRLFNSGEDGAYHLLQVHILLYD